ncbi:pyridoxamine 5'-phosphate oxidase family protein [Peptoniphilus sp. HMSC062D09]|uniref:pyridoxamine 5'-phosphate oxidase family protein n=1 Tax=Peptoniphilus sp. HMSC062D09 TaxID=1739305 RepID=UPI0008A23FF1|nr:pyridoxamine 5'-phosphate oxidase family protein [Peptoniphilus sp. HMSC062D09]OFK84054.1 5-nitroimidazole antibiotic resistance protein [Peptoniphilus sp. HMSC062D09]
MFRQMRRIKQELPLDEAKKLLIKNKRGVLSLNGEEGYPYSLPINYFYDEEENKIYFHGAKTGYKVDCIKNNNKASFVTYGDEELSDNGWSYYLKSVVVFGKIEIVEDRELSAKKLRELGAKYYPSLSEVDAVMERSFDKALVYYLDTKHMTCKKVHEK